MATTKVSPRMILLQGILLVIVTWSRVTESQYYLDDDEENGSDSIIQSSGSGCGGVSEENCSVIPADNNTIIVPNVKVTKSRVPNTTINSPETTEGKANDFTTPEPEVTSSGDNGCDDDDNDGCENGSGPIEDVTDDIGFGTSEEETAATQSIVITPNMTEVPPKDMTSSHLTPSTVPPSRVGGGGGAGGGPGGGGVNPNPPNEGGSKDSTKDKGNPLSLNIGLIVGIAAGVILLLFILGYAVYKYRSRDEGTYKVDETKNYRYETVSTKAPPTTQQHTNGNSTLIKPITNGSKPKKKGAVKEWYV